MDLNHAGRRALVTGSTAGIGLAIAKELASLGATVAINGRTAERVERAIGALRSDLPEGTFVAAPGDVGAAEGAIQVAGAVPTLDILVNNAASSSRNPSSRSPTRIGGASST
jgi:NAD(P)-dependent dehydrogenase (short-subunit alcohol dehydrogenase family)